MTDRDGNATAVGDRIEEVCDQLERLLDEIRDQAQLLREGRDDG